MNVKGLLVLDAVLAEFEQDILNSVAEELRRIGRKIQLTEFEYKPFYEEVRPYVEAILMEGSFVVIETSFHDMDSKYLYHFIEDLEINHRDLITLLHFLKVIPGKTKKLGSYREHCIQEYIFHSGDDTDAWICVCGNHEEREGFSSCDLDGNDMDPVLAPGWADLYRCNSCGRLIEQNTRKIVGINLNPVRNEH